MGDSMAVEIGDSALEGLLKSFGALRLSGPAIHELPFPRTPHVEMLNIDDHTGFQLLSWSGATAPRPDSSLRRDRGVFHACDQGYLRAGLAQHPGKKARGETRRVVAGAEVEGRIGIVCVPLVRTVALCRLALLQVYLGRSTKTLLNSLVGCWVQVFLYRRPLLSIFTHIYHFLSSWPEDVEEMWLPGYVRSELQACTYLAFVAMTDLRANYSPWLYGTDAARTRGGVVRAPVAQSTSAELWRRAEQGGWHAVLEDPVVLDGGHSRARPAASPPGVPRSPASALLGTARRPPLGAGALRGPRVPLGVQVVVPRPTAHQHPGSGRVQEPVQALRNPGAKHPPWHPD